jgi:hypothetical protein
LEVCAALLPPTQAASASTIAHHRMLLRALPIITEAPFSQRLGQTSRQITTQDEGGNALAVVIITFAPSYVAKTCASVKGARRPIVLGDFEEYGVHAEPGKSPQMQIQKLSADSFPAPHDGHRNGEDLPLPCNDAGQNEPDGRAPYARAMGYDISLGEQRCELALAPCPVK